MRLPNLFSRRAQQTFTTPIQPDVAFLAIGDVHGCVKFLEAIPELTASQGWADLPILFVGDYVDRGSDSASVLRWLYDQQQTNPEKVICLMGNHERMMLDTLEEPEKHGRRWLHHGGRETVASFGVQPIMHKGTSEDWIAMRDALREAMGPDLLDWLTNLPLSWQTGNVFACHAGAHPMMPVDMQKSSTLIWGCEEFTKRPREDGIWVLHGHTIVEQAHAIEGRIAIDTGAYATGRLTCAHISQSGPAFYTLSE